MITEVLEKPTGVKGGTEESAFEKVAQLNRLVAREYNAALKKHGITAAQYMTLVSIREGADGVRAAHIGDDFSIEKSTLSRNLKRLEGRGLITRGRLNGRKGRELRVTDMGARVLAAASREWQSAEVIVQRKLAGDPMRGIAHALHLLT